MADARLNGESRPYTTEKHNFVIAVRETRPPTAAGRSGTVITTDGRFLDAWPDTLDILLPGHRYDVETSSREKGGRTYTTIRKATPVAGNGSSSGDANGHTGANGAAGAQSAPPATNGYYRPTVPRDSERMFVCATLTAFIKTGAIPAERSRLIQAIEAIRGAYALTFGQEDAQ